MFHIIPKLTTKKIPMEDAQKKMEINQTMSLQKINKTHRKAAREEKRDKITVQHTDSNEQDSNIGPSLLLIT